MMKNSLKMFTLAALFTAFGLTVFAQDEEGFSASVSGQVRAELEYGTDKKSVAEGGDAESVADQIIGTKTGDTYGKINLNYKADDTKTSFYLRFDADGDKRINFTGETVIGDWTGKAVAEWDELFFTKSSPESTTDVSELGDSIRVRRNQYVSLSNGTMTFTLGKKFNFGSYYKKNDYLFNGFYFQTNTGSDITYYEVNTFDWDAPRQDAFRFDYAISEGISAGVLIGYDNNGGVFNFSGIVARDASGDAIEKTQTTTYGVFFDMSSGPIDLSLEYGTSKDQGINTVADASDDKSFSELNFLALGVAFTAGDLKVGLNYEDFAGKAERKEATTDVIEKLDDLGSTQTNLNVGYALSEDSGVGLGITTLNGKGDDPYNSTTIELGYQTTVSNVLVRPSLISSTFKAAGEDREEGSVQQLKVRMEYSF